MKSEICYSCGKRIETKETYPHYHDRCLKKIFPNGIMPSLNFDSQALEHLASLSIGEGISVPGAQKKLFLHYERMQKGEAKLTFVGYPEGYIFKPQSSVYSYLPEAENCVMSLADICEIPTVPHCLVVNQEGEFSYLCKRIDRIQKGKKTIKIPMEDFAQLSNTLTENKYHSSYERCAKVIDNYSSFALLDKQNLFYRLLFCFLTLNSDMHLKNFSLIEETKGKWMLSPAYDLLPVNLIMKEDQEETALTLHEKKKNLTKKDFFEYGKNIGLGEEVMNYLLRKILSKEHEMLEMIKVSLLPDKMKNEFENKLGERARRLGN